MQSNNQSKRLAHRKIELIDSSSTADNPWRSVANLPARASATTSARPIASGFGLEGAGADVNGKSVEDEEDGVTAAAVAGALKSA